MSERLMRDLITAVHETISANADELTALDQAIGDGDHGLNMARGFDAVSAASDEIAALGFGPAMQKVGMTLVMTVGGASGPLYGSLAIAIGKASATLPADANALAAALESGVDAVKARGKSDFGAKTMLDVLGPIQQSVAEQSSIAAVRAAADAGLESTRDMLATKGRAAFLGQRSIGHLDPGAKSAALIAHAICDVLEQQ